MSLKSEYVQDAIRKNQRKLQRVEENIDSDYIDEISAIRRRAARVLSESSSYTEPQRKVILKSLENEEMYLMGRLRRKMNCSYNKSQVRYKVRKKYLYSELRNLNEKLSEVS